MNISRREEAIDQGLRRQMTAWEHNTPLPGIAVCAVLTWGAYQVNHLPYPPFTMADGRHPVSAVLLALLFGIAIGNLLPVARWLKPGVDIVIRRLLPLGIILLGARLDFYNLIRVGLGALLGAMLLIGVVMLSVHFLQARLGVGGKLSMLLGIGTAICGSSAIAAAAPVIEADRKDVALSIALGGYAVLIRSAPARDPGVPTLIGGTVAAVVAGLVATSGPGLGAPAYDLWMAFIAGGLLIGFFTPIWNYVHRFVPPADVSLLLISEVVMAPLWVWIWQEEEPTAETLVGGGIALGAVLWLTIRAARSGRHDLPDRMGRVRGLHVGAVPGFRRYRGLDDESV